MTTGLGTRQRGAILSTLEKETFDLIIIGGGITGAGIFREASLKGLKALVLEARDFASGTSSKSTKLIHGGLRYLAMGHFHVVREGVLERKRVYQLAPHLAEPKWMMVPARNRFELMKYQVGVTMYEYLGQVADRDRHYNLSGVELSEQEPLLDVNAFPHACIYREYLTDDARLVLANIRGGIQEGGIALNHAPVTGLLKDYGKVTGVAGRCAVTNEQFEVKGKVVVNAAGPWVESVCDLDGLQMEKNMVLSKGVHLVVPRAKLPVNQLVFSVTRDNRPVFVIPRGDVVYIGTTDSLYDGATEWPVVTSEEVNYLLEPVRDYFGVALTPGDCLTTWAGLRPLIFEKGKTTKEISRKDEVWISDSGMVTIAGGKLTGYRKMAEDTIQTVTDILGITLPEGENKPLPGGDFDGQLTQLALDLMQKWPMHESMAQRLVRLYGTEAERVVRLGSQPIGMTPVLVGEVAWAVNEEGAVSIEDVLYRRTRAALYEPEACDYLVDQLGEMMASMLAWTEEHKQEDIARARSRLMDDRVLAAPRTSEIQV